MQAQEYLQRTINRILVVLQEDPEQRAEVMKYALGLSRLCGASLLLVYPVEMPLPIIQGFPAQSPPIMLFSSVWENERAKGQQVIDEALALSRRFGAEAEGRVSPGVNEALQTQANLSYQCDLVVVSRPRKRGLDRLLRRDIAVEIVKNSPCPVVVVEHRSRSARPGQGKRAGEENGANES